MSSGMAYYDHVRARSDFARQAVNALSFEEFQGGENSSAVSLWGRDGLFACRVLCKAPKSKLPLLVPYLLTNSEMQSRPCIRGLISGPREGELFKMSEGQLVREASPDSLGYVWAALRPFLAPVDASSAQRPSRQSNKPDRYGNYVPPKDYDFSSSPSMDAPSSLSGESIGYAEKHPTPPLEDLSLHLIKCFARCVLNYGQSLESASDLEIRDDRLTYRGLTPRSTLLIEAVDDGGLRLFRTNGNHYHVAAIEAKRDLGTILDGSPTVSDHVLAQIVGEALALSLDDRSRPISGSNFVTILAAGKYIKFFHMEITEQFAQSFEDLSPAETNSDPNSFLRVNSTDWFDIGDKNGRVAVANHLLGLANWANVASRSDQMDMED
ncbi:hypothetical protein EDB80DRAFT_741504 [Ilyonectria destructans]|nr:hypothetical protein EDB80DRAFT_741504 [Ilyonectria destructans]